jgi:hypothetical protein
MPRAPERFNRLKSWDSRAGCLRLLPAIRAPSKTQTSSRMIGLAWPLLTHGKSVGVCAPSRKR